MCVFVCLCVQRNACVGSSGAAGGGAGGAAVPQRCPYVSAQDHDKKVTGHEPHREELLADGAGDADDRDARAVGRLGGAHGDRARAATARRGGAAGGRARLPLLGELHCVACWLPKGPGDRESGVAERERQEELSSCVVCRLLLLQVCDRTAAELPNVELRNKKFRNQ